MSQAVRIPSEGAYLADSASAARYGGLGAEERFLGFSALLGEQVVYLDFSLWPKDQLGLRSLLRTELQLGRGELRSELPRGGGGDITVTVDAAGFFVPMCSQNRPKSLPKSSQKTNFQKHEMSAKRPRNLPRNHPEIVSMRKPIARFLAGSDGRRPPTLSGRRTPNMVSNG